MPHMKPDSAAAVPSAKALVLPYPQTPQTAREWVRAHGVSLAELARMHQVPRHTLSDALRGRLRGDRGHAHRAAVVLGMKPNPNQE